MGGYVFGKFFKGKKLTKISPNKTISGTVGSFIFSILLYYFLVSNDFYLNIIMIDLKTDFGNLLLLVTIVVSFSSQLGDLFISYIKRLAKMKDTGKILPGHGGLLDRIDGMLFAIPSGLIVINFF
jgi:phosphatidate cytidylyltransferase